MVMPGLFDTQRKQGRVAVVWLVSASVLSVACADEAAESSGNRDETTGAGQAALVVYTVNYPLCYFAERIGGDLVDVRFPTPPDVDPALWVPGPETVAAYQSADLILLNGASYADWVDRASLPPSRQVHTCRAVTDRYIVLQGDVTHTHGPEGEHAHGQIAFTTWLDSDIAIAQTVAVADAMRAARPDRDVDLRTRSEALEADLIELDARLTEIFGRDRDRPLLASHPVYQYLARRYGLNLESVHFEPGDAPTAAQWRGLAELLKTHPARWMLWEAEPLSETRARLEDMGIGVLVFEPLANAPAEGDYLSGMRANADRLEAAYRSRAASP